MPSSRWTPRRSISFSRRALPACEWCGCGTPPMPLCACRHPCPGKVCAQILFSSSLAICLFFFFLLCAHADTKSNTNMYTRFLPLFLSSSCPQVPPGRRLPSNWRMPQWRCVRHCAKKNVPSEEPPSLLFSPLLCPSHSFLVTLAQFLLFLSLSFLSLFSLFWLASSGYAGGLWHSSAALFALRGHLSPLGALCCGACPYVAGAPGGRRADRGGIRCPSPALWLTPHPCWCWVLCFAF